MTSFYECLHNTVTSLILSNVKFLGLKTMNMFTKSFQQKYDFHYYETNAKDIKADYEDP